MRSVDNELFRKLKGQARREMLIQKELKSKFLEKLQGVKLGQSFTNENKNKPQQLRKVIDSPVPLDATREGQRQAINFVATEIRKA